MRSSHAPARVYVKGLFVAEEPNFLFSYNITKLSAPLRRALNRERSNVGRSAYSDRVKAILTACTSTDVAGPLAGGLNAYATGRLYDELTWRDGNWSGAALAGDKAAAGIHGRPSVSMMSALKKPRSCLAAVER